MLECLERATGPDPAFAVIWLHGLGADAGDFWPIVPELNLPATPSWRFVFPNAPVRPITVNGGMPMRAWFDISSRETVQPVDSDGIAESCRLLEELIEGEEQKGIPRHRILLAGFSQGGTIAARTALLAERPVMGLLLLSTYLPIAAPPDSGVCASGLRCFLAHGRHDDVLPFRLGLELRGMLESAGFKVEWRQYEMGHQLCGQEIVDLAAFLASFAAARTSSN